MDVLDYVIQSELAYHFKMKSMTIQFDDCTEPMLSIFVRTNSEPDWLYRVVMVPIAPPTIVWDLFIQGV